MVNLSFDALRTKPYHGKKYKKVQSFRSEKKASLFADKLESENESSKRFPPLIDKIRIGWRFGVYYRVCVPVDWKI